MDGLRRVGGIRRLSSHEAITDRAAVLAAAAAKMYIYMQLAFAAAAFQACLSV